MAFISDIHIHDGEKFKVKDCKSNETIWLQLEVENQGFTFFGLTTEDLRAALHRYDMERYDADSV